MPLLDSSLGVIVEDRKPARVCQWRNCPLGYRGYEGVKMKACSRCTLVRYCSKKCQREDWVIHKRNCRVPQIIDISEWIQAYRWLFKWAAMEALQVYTHPTKIINEYIVINVLAIERTIGPLASPFLIVNAKLASGVPNEGSMRIKEEGGIGQALIEFNCHMQGGQSVLLYERIPLLEKVPSPPRGYQHFAQWAAVLKGVANGTLDFDDILHLVPSSEPEDGEDRT